MTTATPDFRSLAIQAISDSAAYSGVPAGWASYFDALNCTLPVWATCGDKPHELYLRWARADVRQYTEGRAAPSPMAQLRNQVAMWLRQNPNCPELVSKIAEIQAAYDQNHEYPEDWAPYQRMIDEAAADADVPY